MPHPRSLLHLRYLGLRNSPASVLPKDVGDLKFLQTLDLSGAKTRELPHSLGLRTRLLCLRADADIRVPAGLIGKLTSLQELWIYPAATYTEAAGVSSARHFVKDLGHLRELRILWTAVSIADESMEGDLLASLGNLHKIQTLDIGAMSVLEKGVTWEAGFVFPHQLWHLCLGCFEFCRLPVWLNSSLLPNLLYLKVDVQVVQDQDMETLGRLPELRCLKLYSRYTRVVSISKASCDGYFRNLTFFRTSGSSIRFDRHGCCQCLESLEIGVHVRFLKDANLLGFEKLGLHNLPTSLESVFAKINCSDACAAEVNEAEVVLTHVAAVHPHHPTIKPARICEGFMLSPNQEASAINPKVVHASVNVREMKDGTGYFNFLSLLRNPCIEEFRISINCMNARIEEVEEAEAATRYAVDVHPNCPTLELTRHSEDSVLSDQQSNTST